MPEVHFSRDNIFRQFYRYHEHLQSENIISRHHIKPDSIYDDHFSKTYWNQWRSTSQTHLTQNHSTHIDIWWHLCCMDILLLVHWTHNSASVTHNKTHVPTHCLQNNSSHTSEIRFENRTRLNRAWKRRSSME